MLSLSLCVCIIYIIYYANWQQNNKITDQDTYILNLSIQAYMSIKHTQTHRTMVKERKGVNRKLQSYESQQLSNTVLTSAHI